MTRPWQQQPNTTEQTATARSRSAPIAGVVASDKGDKTIKVVVELPDASTPKYGKYLKRRTVLHAHDEKNEAKRRRHASRSPSAAR